MSEQKFIQEEQYHPNSIPTLLYAMAMSFTNGESELDWRPWHISTNGDVSFSVALAPGCGRRSLPSPYQRSPLRLLPARSGR